LLEKSKFDYSTAKSAIGAFRSVPPNSSGSNITFHNDMLVEAVDEFREALPSLTEMIVKAVEGPKT
tara:strand:- start:89 stop:286 length:198 start_codon:yes stop_codon:yes gene_type:complete